MVAAHARGARGALSRAAAIDWCRRGGHDAVVRLVRADARNLVGNPGFELDNPEPWALGGTGASLTEKSARSGRAALHLVPGTRAVQILHGLEPGALYVARGWLHSVQGKAEMTYAETHKPANGKRLFAGAAQGTGKYELTTLLFRPELDPTTSRGHVDVKFSLYTGRQGQSADGRHRDSVAISSGRICGAVIRSEGTARWSWRRSR